MIPLITDAVETVKFAATGATLWNAEKGQEALRDGRGIVATALLGKTTFVLTSPQGLRFFYDESRVARAGAMVVTSRVLTGGDSPDVVTELDGEKHAARKALLNQATATRVVDLILQAVWAPRLATWTSSVLERIAANDTLALTLNVYDDIELLVWQAGFAMAIGLDAVSEDLLASVRAWKKGYNSLPLDIPLTAFHYAVQGRDAILGIIRHQLTLHRQEPEKYQHTLLSVLLAHQNDTLSDDAIVHESLHFFQAITGIPMVIASTLIGLSKTDAKHSLALQKELKDPSSQAFLTSPTTTNVKDLPILSRTVKEALRRYVVLPFRLGTCIEQSEFDGVLVNKGDTLMASFWAVHMNPNVYPSPETFDPDRWIGNEFGLLGPSKSESPLGLFEFVAFGGTTRDQRQCAGGLTAFTIIRFAVAKILSSLDIQIPKDQDFTWKQNLVVPVDGMPCLVRKA